MNSTLLNPENIRNAVKMYGPVAYMGEKYTKQDLAMMLASVVSHLDEQASRLNTFMLASVHNDDSYQEIRYEIAHTHGRLAVLKRITVYKEIDGLPLRPDDVVMGPAVSAETAQELCALLTRTANAERIPAKSDMMMHILGSFFVSEDQTIKALDVLIDASDQMWKDHAVAVSLCVEHDPDSQWINGYKALILSAMNDADMIDRICTHAGWTPTEARTFLQIVSQPDQQMLVAQWNGVTSCKDGADWQDRAHRRGYAAMLEWVRDPSSYRVRSGINIC